MPGPPDDWGDIDSYDGLPVSIKRKDIVIAVMVLCHYCHYTSYAFFRQISFVFFLLMFALTAVSSKRVVIPPQHQHDMFPPAVVVNAKHIPASSYTGAFRDAIRVAPQNRIVDIRSCLQAPAVFE